MFSEENSFIIKNEEKRRSQTIKKPTQEKKTHINKLNEQVHLSRQKRKKTIKLNFSKGLNIFGKNIIQSLEPKSLIKQY